MLAAHLDAHQAPQAAASAIGADQVARVDRLGTSRLVGEDHLDAALILRRRLKAAVETQRHAFERRQIGLQYRFELILWNPLRVFAINILPLRCAGEGVFETGDDMSRQARRENNVRWIVRAERRGLQQILGDAPTAQMLAGATVRGLGTGRIANPIIALENETGNTTPAELDRRGQAGGTGANNHHIKRCCVLPFAHRRALPLFLLEAGHCRDTAVEFRFRL